MPNLKEVVPAPRTGGKFVYAKLSDYAIGDVIEGIYLERMPNVKYGGWKYKIFTTDNELIVVNGTIELDRWLEVIQPDTWICITILGKKPTPKGEMIELRVQEGDEDDQVAALRALAKEADAAKAETNDSQPQESLDQIFSDTSIPF